MNGAEARWPRVAVLALAVLATAAGLGLLSTIDRPGDLGWRVLVFALAAHVLERFAIDLQHDGETHTFTLSEVALVAGLFLLSPVELVVGRLLGGAILLGIVDRLPPLKVAFNAGCHLLECAVILWFAGHLGIPGAGLGADVLFGTTAAVVGANLLTGTLVWVAVALMSGEAVGRRLAQILRLSTAIAAANTCLALAGVVLWLLAPQAVWLLAVPLLGAWLVHRQYIVERERRLTLSMLYEVSVDAARTTTDLAETLGLVSSRLRARLSARGVEIHLVRDGAAPVSVGSRLGGAATGRLDGGFAPSVARSLAAGRPVRARSRGQVVEVATSYDLGPGRRLAFRVWGPQGLRTGFGKDVEDLLRGVAPRVGFLIDGIELHEAKRGFLNVVSHELRTPLAVVVGMAETLRHRRLPAPHRTAITASLDEHAKALARLLDDLLDVDRLRFGDVTPRREQLDAAEASRAAVAVAAEGRTVEVEVPAETVSAYVDPVHLERILVNLVGNACKYGGSDARIRVHVLREGLDLVLVVEDGGPGIPDDQREAVFEAFHRLDHDHHAPGTGIGLNLVRRLAELHGGSAVVGRSAELGGARFEVRLPCVPDAVASVVPEAA